MDILSTVFAYLKHNTRRIKVISYLYSSCCTRIIRITPSYLSHTSKLLVTVPPPEMKTLLRRHTNKKLKTPLWSILYDSFWHLATFARKYYNIIYNTVEIYLINRSPQIITTWLIQNPKNQTCKITYITSQKAFLTISSNRRCS